MENVMEKKIENIKSGEDLYFLTCRFTIGNYFKYLRSGLNTKREILETITDLLTNDKILGYTENIQFDEMNIRSEKFLDEICDEEYLEVSRKNLERLSELVEMKEPKRVALVGGREQDSHEFITNEYNEKYNKKDFIDWDTFLGEEKGVA